MRKSEEYEMALVAEQVLGKAIQKYDELAAQLKENNDGDNSDLLVTIRDSIHNLKRKIEAYFRERITMEKVLDEFVFEYQVLEGELEIRKNDPASVKKFAKKLLVSYEDFIRQSGGKKKLAIISGEETPGFEKKSVGIAYIFWVVSFFGVLGLHRFYLGRTGTGIGWLLTGGLLGFGAIYDLLALPKMVKEQNMYNELRAAKIKQLTGASN